MSQNERDQLRRLGEERQEEFASAGFVLPQDVVHDLLKQIEQTDACTAAHTWRVVFYTRALCEAAGLHPEAIAIVSAAAALHDVGKLDVPANILRKPGKLTDEEFEQIKLHTVFGYDRLRTPGIDHPSALNLVRHHHERIDGRGYPDGLAGEAIPPGARYFAVIDSFDAMTSIRPYRKETGPEAAEAAIRELEAGIGSRYCDEAVRLFVDEYRSGALDWILQYFNDSCPVPDYGNLNQADAMSKAKRPG